MNAQPERRRSRWMRRVFPVGANTIGFVAAFGRFGNFLSEGGRAIADVGTWGPLLMLHMRKLGVDSLPIALFLAAFTVCSGKNKSLAADATGFLQGFDPAIIALDGSGVQLPLRAERLRLGAGVRRLQYWPGRL